MIMGQPYQMWCVANVRIEDTHTTHIMWLMEVVIFNNAILSKSTPTMMTTLSMLIRKNVIIK